jgi:sn-glycerol 3-phosphate transport system substrate-binding protein
MSQPIGTRRPRSLLLALLAAMALLAAACGGDDGADGDGGGGGGGNSEDVAAQFDCPVGAHTDADGTVEVTVWHAYNAATQETLESIAADYNASQDKVKVTVQAQGTYEELLTKYETAVGDPETLPDVVFAEDTNTQVLMDSGTVLPSGSCIDADPQAEEFYDDVVPSVKAAYTVEGALWPAAFGVSMPVMYVNDDHLRAAGLSTDEYPGTFEELRTAAEQIKAANLPGLEAPVVITNNGWFVENWLTGAGEAIVDQANGHDGLAANSEFDNEASAEIFEWLRSMSEDGLLKTFPGSGFDQYFSLAQQRGSILIDGSRAITSIVQVIDSARADLAGVPTDQLSEEDLQGLDVDVAPIVGLEEPGQGGVAGSAGWLVAGEDDATVAGGWDFLRFFNSKDNQVRWAIEGSYLPVTASAQEDPRLVDAFETTRGGGWLNTAYQQLQGTNAEFASPIMGPFKEFRVAVQEAMEAVIENGADPAATISDLDTQFQADLEDYAREVG